MFAALILFGLVGSQAVVAVTAETSKALGPFSRVESHLSIPIQISDDGSKEPTLTVTGGTVEQAVRIQVQGDLLTLNQPNGASADTSINISVKPGALKDLTTNGAGKVLVSGSAVASDSFNLTARGSGDVVVSAGSLTSLAVWSRGSGDALVKATSIKQTDLKVYGSGDLTVAGATAAVKVDLRGSGDAKIIGSDSTVITGEVKSDAEVSYTAGQCTVTSTYSGNSTPCEKTDRD